MSTLRQDLVQLTSDHLRQLKRIRRQDLLIAEYIKVTVAAHYNIAVHELSAKTRGQEHISWPRQIAMTLCREFTKHSSTQIGAYFGNRDHSTVLHAHTKVKDRYDTDNVTKREMDGLRALLAEKLKAA